jgi:hypothetical protein
MVRNRGDQHAGKDWNGLPKPRRKHEAEELGSIAHLGDGDRRKRNEECLHRRNPDRLDRNSPPSGCRERRK